MYFVISLFLVLFSHSTYAEESKTETTVRKPAATSDIQVLQNVPRDDKVCVVAYNSERGMDISVACGKIEHVRVHEDTMNAKPLSYIYKMLLGTGFQVAQCTSAGNESYCILKR